jgi:teichuronic acid biosynthesis glycosyltransferase TuaC
VVDYTLALFANMYPAFDGDYRANFIRQMVRDLELRGVAVKKAVKTSSSISGYFPFYYQSLLLSRDRDLDLLQAEYIPHSSLIPAFFKRWDVPLIMKFHGDDARIYPFKNRFNLMLTRSMLKRADYVITTSEEMRQVLMGIGANPDRISAIHTGVDTVFLSPASKEESRKKLGLTFESTLFLFVGRLHIWKGIGELLEVAKMCPDLGFVFVGPGPVPIHTANCMFVGTKTPREVREWLNASDCLVLPTHTEAVPTSVMEAFACGLPAITTDVGGCPEIVEHQKNGLIVPVRDVKALKDAVMWMHHNPDQRREMGKQGRMTVIERFDHNKMIEKLITVHRILLQRKKNP